MKLNPDEISPITGNLCVFVEYDINSQQDTKLCMESGYHTFESWKIGSEELKRFEDASPEFILKTRFEDGDQIWYKITMFTKDALLCPEDDGRWKVNSFRELSVDETFDPIEMIMQTETDGEGNEIKRVLDEKYASYFSETEFEDAIIEFYKRCSEKYV